MAAPNKPLVYLLYGDDEFEMHEFVRAMQDKLGDETTASLNMAEFDGETATLDAVRGATQSMPFLAERRLVVLTHPLALGGRSQQEHAGFVQFLDSLPHTTALVLLMEDTLRRGAWSTLHEKHWLMQWANEHADKVFQRGFSTPKGRALAERTVKNSAQKISIEAALRLVDLTGDEPRLVEMEMEKLLAYVNYQRVIQKEDVEAVTADVREESVFDFVDALGRRDGRRAVQSLRRLLEQQDGHAVFAMVVRQFRLLLQAREVLHSGGSAREIMQQVEDAKSAFVADKLVSQAKYFSLADLDAIYHKLVEIDEEIKTSRTEVDTALYVLTAALARS